VVGTRSSFSWQPDLPMPLCFHVVNHSLQTLEGLDRQPLESPNKLLEVKRDYESMRQR